MHANNEIDGERRMLSSLVRVRASFEKKNFSSRESSEAKAFVIVVPKTTDSR